jgi:hypothetical protein
MTRAKTVYTQFVSHIIPKKRFGCSRFPLHICILCAVVLITCSCGSGESRRFQSAVAATHAPAPSSSAVSVTISPGNLVLPPGTARQLTATVTGSSNGSVTWTAAQGSITQSGLYTAPTVSSSTVDTVSAVSTANPSSYATITVNVQATSTTTAVYSITSQESVSNVPYPQSLVSKPLPGDKMNHLFSNSAAIVSTALSDGGNTPSYRYGQTYLATPGVNDIDGVPVYYATSSDPVYTITSCTYHGSGTRNPVGHSFHFPSGAQFGGNPNGGGCSYGSCMDQFVVIWDQTQNVLFSSYVYGSSHPALPSCSGHCYISLYYCGMANRATDSGYGNAGAGYATNGLSPEAGIIRAQELVQGQINHALLLNTGCTNGQVVFPNQSPSNTAAVCSNRTNRPPNGALVFLDYTPTQLATLKTKLPAWQYPIVAAMSTYGGYISDTGGSIGARSIEPSRIESGQSYRYYGKGDPVWNFMSANCGTGCNLGVKAPTPPKSSQIYSLDVFANIPNLPGPACSSSSCGVVQHMHIADPCVAKGLAGLSSTQGACF